MHKAIEISLITYESYLKPFQMQTWPSQPVEATKPGVPHKLQSAPKTNSVCSIKINLQPWAGSILFVLPVNLWPSSLRSVQILHVISYDVDNSILL